MPQFENGWNIFSVNSTGYTVEYHVKKITNDNSLVYGRDYDVYVLMRIKHHGTEHLLLALIMLLCQKSDFRQTDDALAVTPRIS